MVFSGVMNALAKGCAAALCPHLSAAAQQVQGLWENDLLRIGEYAVLVEGFVAAAAAGGDAALQSQATPLVSLNTVACEAALRALRSFSQPVCAEHLHAAWPVDISPPVASLQSLLSSVCLYSLTHKHCCSGARARLVRKGLWSCPLLAVASVPMLLLQVLQWTLEPVRAAWASPALSAGLASPAAFFGYYIALQPDPAGGVVVCKFPCSLARDTCVQGTACSLRTDELRGYLLDVLVPVLSLGSMS